MLRLRGPARISRDDRVVRPVPAPTVTRWLTIDPVGKRIVMEPAVAIPEASRPPAPAELERPAHETRVPLSATDEL